jgi:2-keto-4-pentenoate hydratase
MMNWLDWQGYLDTPAVRSYSRAYIEARVSNSGSLPRFSELDPAASLDQAFAVQRRSVRTVTGTGVEIAGYKGAFTSAAAQEAFGITQPVHGVLYEPGRVDGTKHATITVDPERPILVETEIGYIMAVDIGTKVLAPRQAMTAAEAIVPVIELPANVGALMTGAPNVLDMTAANVGSNLYIVGSPVDPKAIANPDLLKVSLSRDGKLLHQSTGADAREGQAQNLMNLINQIVDQGRVIHKGDIIVSGSLGGARPGEKGTYSADFGALGLIEFTIE